MTTWLRFRSGNRSVNLSGARNSAFVLIRSDSAIGTGQSCADRRVVKDPLLPQIKVIFKITCVLLC